MEDGGVAASEALKEGGGGTTEGAREEGGGAVTKALREGGIRQPVVQVVQVKPLATDIKDKDLDTIWTDMSKADAGTALQSCATLYGAKQALTYLKDHLKVKVADLDEKEVSKLIANLDADEYTTREDSEAKLAKMGPAVMPALEKAAKDFKAPEIQMRLGRLLDKFKENNPLRQAERGLEVLVALRTPEAKQLLQDLAKGDDKDWLAQHAKKAAERAK